MRPYLAYGSNMIVADMRRRCPTARVQGVARLRDHRFRIVRSGYASLARESGAIAYGILWSISAADEQRLDTYEEVAAGLYRRAHLAVDTIGKDGKVGNPVTALVYLARDAGLGRPRRFYLEPILAAMQAHGLPGEALANIARWLPA
jgi:gamma-glutamylcyclotransferase